MTLSEKNIQTLIEQANKMLTTEEIYSKSLRYIDLEALKEQSEREPLTVLELQYSFAVSGFFAGIRYTLENIDLSTIEEEQKGEA